MHRYIDTFFVILGVFVLSFVLCGLLTARFAVKLTVSFFVAIAAVCMIAYIVRGGKSKRPDYRSFVTYCILSEEAEIAKLFEKAGFIENTVVSDGFYKTSDGYACFHLKYSKPSRDYIVSLYKKCIKADIKKLTVWCAEFERQAVAIACNLPEAEIKFRTLRPFYKKLKKQQYLQQVKVKPLSHGSLKTLLPIVFSTRNSYRFAFVSIILYALSLLTPLKAYYIAVATIVLALAIVSRIYGEKSDRSA